MASLILVCEATQFNMDAERSLEEELQNLLDEQANFIELLNGSHSPLEFNASYQVWYSRAIKLLELLLPSRLPEFISYYEAPQTREKMTENNYVIQDYVTLKEVETHYGTNLPRWDITQVTQLRLTNQIHILSGLNHSALHGVVQEVTDSIYSDVLSKELRTSAKLLSEGEVRAAGVIAGVALESSLKNELSRRGIGLSNKKPGIQAMNDLLKECGVFNNAMSEYIKSLAYIRNICAHDKEIKPNKEEVQVLIDGVNGIINNGFQTR